MDPSKNSRRRDKLLSLLPSRSRNPSPSSNPTTTTATTLGHANISSSAGNPSQSSAQIGATASRSNPSARPSTSPVSSSQTLLDRALQLLSEPDRAILQPQIPSTISDIDAVLTDCYTAVTQKQQEWKDKRWVFTFAGRTVEWKEGMEKIVRWLDRVKDIGDLAAGVDPVHAGLPWAGVRTLLQIMLSDANQMDALVVGCEIVLYMANRLKVYVEFWTRLPLTQEQTNFEDALIKLHSRVLEFLASALRKHQQSPFRRTITSLWHEDEILNFEDECGKLGSRLDAVASDCDRMLAEQDRGVLQRAVQQMQNILTELKQLHTLQETMERVERKVDLSRLRVVEAASFDSYKQEQDREYCHPDTRRDLLQKIQLWIHQADAPTIFWLNGMAGTGKSTISRTVARDLTESAKWSTAKLGASFFFKRGEGYRGSAALLFPTLAGQMATSIDGFSEPLAEALNEDPQICHKALGEQFKRLITQPLQKLRPGPQRTTYVFVVDALDECDKQDDMQTVLRLWSQFALPSTRSIHLRLFLTSRDEESIRRAFKDTAGRHRHLILHEVPQPDVRLDILTYLKHAFTEIRLKYNRSPPGAPLVDDWPGEDTLKHLTDMAVPLFIVAATTHRFIYEGLRPRQRLETVLRAHDGGHRSKMAQVYIPVLQGMTANLSDDETEKTCCDFRTVVGSIVNLAEPLSPSALSDLLEVSLEDVNICLRPLHAVLQIPTDTGALVRPLHLSFGDYLTSAAAQTEKFGVDRAATHTFLWRNCLRLLNGRAGLQENLCGLTYQGQGRAEVSTGRIVARLPPALRYACRYLVHHLQMSPFTLSDDDEVHTFLQEHFLHWLEALSFLDRLADAIEFVAVLRSNIVPNDSSVNVSRFLDDARRFILANRAIGELAPLQLYSSAPLFAPQNSIVRNVCGQTPRWITQSPKTRIDWGLEMQKLEGHTDGVTAVAFSPDGLRLASASHDKTVRMWDAGTGAEVQKLEGHTHAVSAVAFSSDGLRLASASHDKTVRVWDTSTGAEVQKLEGHTDRVTAVVFSPDGLRLTSASHDKTVRVWDASTGAEVLKLEGHINEVRSVAFSPDGLRLASASWDETVRVWDARTGVEVLKLEGHTGMVTAVAFSPNGTRLVSASHDKTVRVWDASTGAEVLKLEGHTNEVRAVAFSPNGLRLASASRDKTVRVWDASTGAEVQKLEGHTVVITAVAFSPDGTRLASASRDDTVRVWDADIEAEVQKLEGHTSMVTAVAFSPNGTRLVSASHDKTVRVWDASTGAEVLKLEGHTNAVSAVAFSPDGLWLASASHDKTVRVWDASTGAEVQKLEGHTDTITAVVFSPDRLRLASTSHDWTVRVWDAGTGAEVLKLEGHADIGSAVAFSPNGLRLASASYDKTVRVWDAGTGAEVQKLEGHTDRVTAVAFSPDGLRLASASHDRTVQVWDASTGVITDNFRLSYVSQLSFTADSKALITSRGCIQLHATHDTSTQSTTQHIMNLVLDGIWIEYRGKDVLWLPHDYRSTITAVFGNLFAIGTSLGAVVFIRLDVASLFPNEDGNNKHLVVKW